VYCAERSKLRPDFLPLSAWEDFLAMAAQKLSLQHSQAAPVAVFDADGRRLERLEDISHDQVLFVAHAGEAFAKALPLAVEKANKAAGAAEDVGTRTPPARALLLPYSSSCP
jgi:hypothetical protein